MREAHSRKSANDRNLSLLESQDRKGLEGRNLECGRNGRDSSGKRINKKQQASIKSSPAAQWGHIGDESWIKSRGLEQQTTGVETRYPKDFDRGSRIALS